MKRFISKFIPVAILLIGMALLLYPTISEYINSIHQSKAISNYNSLTAEMDTEDFEHFFEAAQDFNEAIYTTEGVFYRPDYLTGYEDVLDITGTGIMGYITIDKIGVELPIYHSVDENVLQVAVGHMPGTSLPIGGENTHAVLSGHRGLPSARLFTDLDELEVGDIFTISVLNRVLTYQVDLVKVVLPKEVDDLQIVPGEDHCSLVTCTPYGINTHRLIVRGTRIENIEEVEIYVANEAFKIEPIIVMPIVAAPMLIVLAIILEVESRKRRREKKRLGKEKET